MAAGLGFKTFTTGEVLTAGDVNGYLMQGINVFASSAARASAITSPQEGQYSFLKDTNALEYYDGAAWVGAPVGDITAVTAGTGISGGGSSGAVTITNSMATEIAAKGDLIVGTGSATFDNLTVGANNTVIQADSTAATGLKYSTPAAVVGNIVTAKGDVIAATGSGAVTNLAVGTNGQVLQADSTAATGLKWATASSSAGPAFSAYRATSSQSFTVSTFVKVQLNAEFFDTDNCFDTTTNYRFTPTTAGKYQINLSAIISTSAAGRTIWAIYKNGTSYIRLYDDTPTLTAAQSSGAVMIDMNGSTDYLELYVYCAGTSPASDYYSGGTGTIFSGHWARS